MKRKKPIGTKLVVSLYGVKHGTFSSVKKMAEGMDFKLLGLQEAIKRWQRRNPKKLLNMTYTPLNRGCVYVIKRVKI